MNKYYSNKEMLMPFILIYRIGCEKEDIEQRNFADELFKSLLLEIDSRMIGASLLSEMAIGDVLDSDIIEVEDMDMYNDILLEYDLEKLVIDENVLSIDKKRLDAFKTFNDAIRKAYNEYVEKVVIENE